MPRSAAALVESLGLPGLVDVHTHFLPPRMAVKVRAQFDEAGRSSAGRGRCTTARTEKDREWRKRLSALTRRLTVTTQEGLIGFDWGR